MLQSSPSPELFGADLQTNAEDSASNEAINKVWLAVVAGSPPTARLGFILGMSPDRKPIQFKALQTDQIFIKLKIERNSR